MFRAVFCQNGDRMEEEGGILGFPNGEGLDAAGASPRPTGSHGICRTSVWKLACFALQNRRHPLPSRQFHEVRHSE